MAAEPQWGDPDANKPAPNFGGAIGWAAPLRVASPHDETLKALFALNVIACPHSVRRAAAMTTPDTALQQIMVTQWLHDSIVLAVFAKHRFTYDPLLTPSREALISEAMHIYETTYSADEKVKALTLAAKLAGYVTTGTQVNVKNNNVNTSGVMVIRDHGSDAEWEGNAAGQQASLLASAGG